MRMMILLTAALAFPSVGSAQIHPLVGQWNVSVETLVPPREGSASTINRKGMLAVHLAGDSLIATMTLEPVDGMPTPSAQRLAAARRDGKVVFVKSAEASLSGQRDRLARTATVTYTFDVHGDTLAGSMSITVPGIPEIPARAISGTRAP
jgi:hypothetical protein